MRTFERARPSDAESILRLFEEAKRVGRQNGTTDWDETYPNREFIDEDIKNGALWALYEDGKIVATISLLKEDFEDTLDAGWTDANSCILARLCVDTALQSRGVGAEMMRLVTEEAARQGYSATRHLASANNPAALRLYRKLGYRELKHVFFVDTDFIAFEMLIDPRGSSQS
jgi:ribosomal protein S18 acetylase RimI-like enzyme